MLKILSRDNPNATTPRIGANLIPDPWESSNLAPEPQIPQTWQVSSVAQPLLSAVKSPEALISGPTANPEQFVLQDWLKLKAEASNKLSQQIQEILGWLYWMDYSIA